MLHIEVLWTRTFTAEIDCIVDVPDGSTKEEIEAKVKEVLATDEFGHPTSAASTWDGSGFVMWSESGEDDSIDRGLQGDFDE